MSQTEKLYKILSDGLPHRSDSLVKLVYGVGDGVWLARLGARAFDCKKKYGVEIDSWPDPNNRKLWFYQLKAGVASTASLGVRHMPGTSAAGIVDNQRTTSAQLLMFETKSVGHWDF